MAKIDNTPTCDGGFYKIPIINDLGEVTYINPCPICDKKCKFPAGEKIRYIDTEAEIE